MNSTYTQSTAVKATYPRLARHLHWAAVCLAAIVAVSFFSPITVADPPDPASVPDATAQQKSINVVKEIYGKEIAAAKRPEEKSSLAHKILTAAVEETDSASRYALLTVAKDMAVSANDLPLAWDVIDQMQKAFQIDAAKAKADVAVLSSRSLRTPKERVAFVPLVDELIPEFLKAGRFDLARQISEIALSAARQANDPELVRQAALRLQEVKETDEAFAEAKQAAAVLQNDPENAAANLKVGRFRCLIQGDWDGGLGLLSRGSDARLKKLADMERAGAESSDEQVLLADGWWDVGETESGIARSRAQAHAAHWYQQALPGLNGLAKAKAEKRLQEATSVNAVKRPTTGQPAATVAADALTTPPQPEADEAAKTRWRAEAFAARNIRRPAGSAGPIQMQIRHLDRYARLQLVPSWEEPAVRTKLDGHVIDGQSQLYRRNSPYLISGQLLIKDKATLAVEGGTVLLFDDGASIENNGTLSMESDGDWIVLAPADREKPWKGITGSGRISGRRCLIVGSKSKAAIQAARTEAFNLTECVFAANSRAIDCGNNAGGTVTNSLFFRNTEAMFMHGDGGRVTFSRCLLIANGTGIGTNFSGYWTGSKSTVAGNHVGLAAPQNNVICKLTGSNVVGNVKEQIRSRGARVQARANFWGQAAGSNPQMFGGTGTVDAGDSRPTPFDDALPALPKCPFLDF